VALIVLESSMSWRRPNRLRMLPDAWELTYFPSLATQGGDADFDADGLTNYEEFLYDTLSSTIRFLITVSPDSTSR
jgi:hypothetical protein